MFSRVALPRRRATLQAVKLVIHLSTVKRGAFGWNAARFLPFPFSPFLPIPFSHHRLSSQNPQKRLATILRCCFIPPPVAHMAELADALL